MADSSYTMTGWAEHLAAVDQLPALTVQHLRSVAHTAAARLQARARANLIAQQKTTARALADNITVVDDPANRQYIVLASAPAGQPANVPIWNEHGTVKMPARPFMRPAAVAEEPVYLRDVEGAAQAVLNALVK